MSQLSLSSALTQASDPNMKFFHDPVHGLISLGANINRFIDTPQFQRLRDLKQLGVSYYVFPGATHNRFEHCLGVGHLAKAWMDILRIKQPELEIDDRDVQLVTLAGLCHDLGHGPFSHVFDGRFMPQARPDGHWHHEAWSEMLLDHMIDENAIDIDTEDVKLVKRLISGKRPSSGEKLFMYDIVSNERNSIDVDKWDYLSRDCLNVGMKTDYDCTRLLNYSRVIGDEICFAEKEAFNIYQMLHTRYSLFKQVYSHRVGQAIESMIVDALLLADPVLKISEAVDDPAAFTQLTDCILRDIERSKEPELEPARKLIFDIRKRRLYRFVDEFYVDQQVLETGNFSRSNVTAQRIASFSETLSADDIVVNWTSIHFGLPNGANPLSKTRFFSRWEATEARHISPENVSALLPRQYKEDCIRIFAKDIDKMHEAQAAFRQFKRAVLPQTSERAFGIPDASSPKKRRFL